LLRLEELKAAHPDLIAFVQALRMNHCSPYYYGFGAVNSHRVYLIDPLANLMMFYAPEAKSKGMLDDMKRLLRLSSIG